MIGDNWDLSEKVRGVVGRPLPSTYGLVLRECREWEALKPHQCQELLSWIVIWYGKPDRLY
jgi:hypothetical protein